MLSKFLEHVALVGRENLLENRDRGSCQRAQQALCTACVVAIGQGMHSDTCLVGCVRRANVYEPRIYACSSREIYIVVLQAWVQDPKCDLIALIGPYSNSSEVEHVHINGFPHSHSSTSAEQ